MSLACHYIPWRICSCNSQNALWFLLLCWAAIRCWLHVRNHLPHLLCKIIHPIHQSVSSAWCFWKYVIYLSLFWFDLANITHRWNWYAFRDLSLNIICAPVPGFVLSMNLEWHLISALTNSTAICMIRSPSLLINTVHCVWTMWQPLKRTFQVQMWQKSSLRFCQYPSGPANVNVWF